MLKPHNCIAFILIFSVCWNVNIFILMLEDMKYTYNISLKCSASSCNKALMSFFNFFAIVINNIYRLLLLSLIKFFSTQLLKCDYSYGCIILCKNRRISFCRNRKYILSELPKFAPHGCVTWSYINMALNFLNLSKVAQFEMMNRCGLYVSVSISACYWNKIF